MRFDYVYHNVFKRIGLERIEKGLIVHLWKLSVKVSL